MKTRHVWEKAGPSVAAIIEPCAHAHCKKHCDKPHSKNTFHCSQRQCQTPTFNQRPQRSTLDFVSRYRLDAKSKKNRFSIFLKKIFLGPPHPPPPLEWISSPPLVAAVLMKNKGDESPGSIRMGVIGALVIFSICGRSG